MVRIACRAWSNGEFREAVFFHPRSHRQRVSATAAHPHRAMIGVDRDPYAVGISGVEQVFDGDQEDTKGLQARIDPACVRARERGSHRYASMPARPVPAAQYAQAIVEQRLGARSRASQACVPLRSRSDDSMLSFRLSWAIRESVSRIATCRVAARVSGRRRSVPATSASFGSSIRQRSNA
jgi:hypothetical protein